jgi:hypothetical protein
MRAETRDKLRRLADSATIPGEKAAAHAALERFRPAPRPAVGSPEYFDALRAHGAVIDYCSINRDLPDLTRSEIKTIMNFVRYRGTPWEDGATELNRIARKIRSAGRE